MATSVAHARVVCIAQGDLTDHADASLPGTIAWHFKQGAHGEANTYVLTSALASDNPDRTSYKLGRTLTIPPSATLTSGAWQAQPGGRAARCVADGQVTVQLRASTGLDDQMMIRLSDGSTLDHLELHGNATAGIIVYAAAGTTGGTIRNCAIHDTKNDYAAETRAIGANTFHPRPHLVFLDRCVHMAVTENVLRRAGCAPKLNAASWIGAAAAIYAPGNTNLVIRSNDIAFTLSAGVDFTGSTQVLVEYNSIRQTGLNATYPDCASCGGLHTADAIADGITAYHNGHGTMLQDITVRRNFVVEYHNHGIHLSGRGLSILSNVVYDGVFDAIHVADWREAGFPGECGSNVDILDNVVAKGSSARHNWPIYIDGYNPSTYNVRNEAVVGTDASVAPFPPPGQARYCF